MYIVVHINQSEKDRKGSEMLIEFFSFRFISVRIIPCICYKIGLSEMSLVMYTYL